MQLSRRQLILSGAAGLMGLPRGGVLPARAQPSQRALALINAARSQIGVTTRYNGAYQRLPYPNGDIPRQTGVCTDVIIRAYRDAFNLDLQSYVHEDLKQNFDHYPALWGLTKPDRNIDHRRVPNLETFFARRNAEKPTSHWNAGDIISLRLAGNLPHIGIISDRQTISAHPFVIHNIGQGTREEDISLLPLASNRYSKERRFCYFPTI